MTAVIEELGQDMRLDLDAGRILPKNGQGRAVAVVVGEHGTYQGDLAREPSAGSRPTASAG